MPTLFKSPLAQNGAAVKASYEASTESIKPPAGHIPEIKRIDSPPPAEMRSEILQAIDIAALMRTAKPQATTDSGHESR